MSELKRTPVFSEYKAYGGKTIDFGGWDLPVQFSGIKNEHEATRTKAGLFDVSHMGEITVRGSKAAEFLQRMTTNDISKLSPKRAHYTFLCYENGGVVDDLIIYMLGENNYLLVVNAANTAKDFEWLTNHNNYDSNELELKDESDKFGLLAIQGPLAESILQEVTDTDLSEVKFFQFKDNVAIHSIEDKALISRSGYTGEDGFEIYIAPESVGKLWNLLLDKGVDKGLVPAGLGARDTLRFEANLPLYGQELTENISPIEAGLKFAVKVDKEADFIGKDALQKQVTDGPERKIVGIEMIDKGIPRTEYEVLFEDKVIGHVTSGTQSPTLGKNVGRAIIDAEYAEVGKELLIQVRKRQLKAQIVATPFYKRGK